MSLQQVFSIAAAIIAAVGGAGVVVVGLSGWLGKVWTDRLMQSQRADHERKLERLGADLKTAAETELDQLRSTLDSEADVLLRRPCAPRSEVTSGAIKNIRSDVSYGYLSRRKRPVARKDPFVV